MNLPVALVGDGDLVPCVDAEQRVYVALDAAASTGALTQVMDRVVGFVPSYSSVHRGAGFKSQFSTAQYEAAREAALAFAQRRGRDDVAIICRNTTEAINHLVYRLNLRRDDVIVTTVIEHHANLLPWSRAATCRYVECGTDGTYTLADVIEALDALPRPRLLTLSGASNITGWMPPLAEIIAAAHERDIAVVVDAAQLAPHRPLPPDADFVVWSGHKMYAPFGTGILIGPRSAFSQGEPFLAGGGAVDFVALDEVLWTAPPEREEAGSPNVVGAVALHAAIDTLSEIGWPTIIEHDRRLARQLREGLMSIPGVRVLGPGPDVETLPVATFTVRDVPFALVAARLSAEFAIGVRHGCFCAHPYLTRLLGLDVDEVARFRDDIRHGDRRTMPGAVRASCGINTSADDVQRLLDAITQIAGGLAPPVAYHQDATTGDFYPESNGDPVAPMSTTGGPLARRPGGSCSAG
ncbi:MAG: aminotransferase class V-fold PLP-dependent enzyme [Acidobacteria bacterium]|nr:aminotransferase class V-fold PLP-dependent enzyme [Acidobacteriota bacterium]